MISLRTGPKTLLGQLGWPRLGFIVGISNFQKMFYVSDAGVITMFKGNPVPGATQRFIPIKSGSGSDVGAQAGCLAGGTAGMGLLQAGGRIAGNSEDVMNSGGGPEDPITDALSITMEIVGVGVQVVGIGTTVVSCVF